MRALIFRLDDQHAREKFSFAWLSQSIFHCRRSGIQMIFTSTKQLAVIPYQDLNESLPLRLLIASRAISGSAMRVIRFQLCFVIFGQAEFLFYSDPKGSKNTLSGPRHKSSSNSFAYCVTTSKLPSYGASRTSVAEKFGQKVIWVSVLAWQTDRWALKLIFNWDRLGFLTRWSIKHSTLNSLETLPVSAKQNDQKIADIDLVSLAIRSFLDVWS